MTHTFHSEVSLHSWLLWPMVRRPPRKVPWQRENFKNNIFTCMNWSISQISLSNNVLQYSKIDIFKSKFLLWNGISISKNSEIKIWYRPSGGLLLLDMHFRTQWGQIASTSYSFWFKGEGRLWQQFLQKAHSYQQCLTWNMLKEKLIYKIKFQWIVEKTASFSKLLRLLLDTYYIFQFQA